MFCEQCGNKNPDNAVFCTKCGEPADNNNKKQVTKKGKKGVIVIVVGYILAIIFPIIGAIIGLNLMVKGKALHGIIILVLSSFSFFCWTVIFGA